MKFNRLFTAACVAAILGFSTLSAQDNDTSQTDEDRIARLEEMVGQLTALLQAQQQSKEPATPEPTPSEDQSPPPASTNSTSTEKLIPGVILEVWSLKQDFKGEAPSGRSMGGFLDTGELFQLSNFWSDPMFEFIKDTQVGLRWSGFYRAQKSGPYTFSVEIRKADTKGKAQLFSEWFTSLRISSQPVISIRKQLPPQQHHSWGQYATENPYSFVSSETLDLESGFYPFELFTYFSYNLNNVRINGSRFSDGLIKDEYIGFSTYKPYRIILRVRGPDDVAPVIIDSTMLYVKE